MFTYVGVIEKQSWIGPFLDHGLGAKMIQNQGIQRIQQTSNHEKRQSLGWVSRVNTWIKNSRPDITGGEPLRSPGSGGFDAHHLVGGLELVFPYNWE